MSKPQIANSQKNESSPKLNIDIQFYASAPNHGVVLNPSNGRPKRRLFREQGYHSQIHHESTRIVGLAGTKNDKLRLDTPYSNEATTHVLCISRIQDQNRSPTSKLPHPSAPFLQRTSRGRRRIEQKKWGCVRLLHG